MSLSDLLARLATRALTPSPLAILVPLLLAILLPLLLHYVLYRDSAPAAERADALPTFLLLGPRGAGKTALLMAVRVVPCCAWTAGC